MGPCLRRPPHRLVRGAACCLALAILAAPLPARASKTIRVPEDKPTLQAAVAAAVSGDVILFAPGTYTGGAFIDHKRLIFESWYGFTSDTSYISRTVLNGVIAHACGGAPGCAGNAVLEFGADAHNSQVIGLTLTNGENGVAASSKVSLTACHVIANGDGVDYVAGAGGTFRDCLFANNTDDGIDLNGGMDLTVTNNVIRDNGDDGIEYRLYSYIGPITPVTISGNRITGNAEDGVQIIDYSSVDSFVVRIERNLFESNFDASGSSAGIGCMGSGNTVENLSGAAVAERIYVIHNTFIGEKNGLVGGGNTIALDNIFSGIPGKAVRRVAGRSVVAHSLFWGNAVNYEASVLDSATLRVADPRLDPNGHLVPGSPAIDAGPPSYVWRGETVLSEPLGTLPDLGAFEFRPNRRPVVHLGPDRLVRLPTPVRLSGAVSDDGNPVPEGMLTFQWSVLSGPAAVTIDTPTAPSTGASFPVEGIYRVRLAASDGELTGADTMTVSVLRLIGLGDYAVTARGDDAEEQLNGVLSPNVMRIELVDSGGSQVVGLRFPNITLPPGATINKAYVQFVADAVTTGPSSLLIQGQASDDPDTFAVLVHNISARPRTAASATWAPPAWTVVGEAGPNERTPDLSAIVQEIVNRPGWRSGHAMALIITGTGRRSAKSYDADPAGAAVLHIEATPALIGVGEGPPSELELRATGLGHGALEVEFALPAAHPATLELIDLAGRRLAAREVGGLGAGRHRLELARGLPSGVFFVRLVQDHHARLLKVPVLR